MKNLFFPYFFSTACAKSLELRPKGRLSEPVMCIFAKSVSGKTFNTTTLLSFILSFTASLASDILRTSLSIFNEWPIPLEQVLYRAKSRKNPPNHRPPLKMRGPTLVLISLIPGKALAGINHSQNSQQNDRSHNRHS